MNDKVQTTQGNYYDSTYVFGWNTDRSSFPKDSGLHHHPNYDWIPRVEDKLESKENSQLFIIHSFYSEPASWYM